MKCESVSDTIECNPCFPSGIESIQGTMRQCDWSFTVNVTDGCLTNDASALFGSALAKNLKIQRALSIVDTNIYHFQKVKEETLLSI